MEKDKIIKAWVYDPSSSLFKRKKTDPAIGHYYTCSNLEKCKIYKKGMCFLMGSNTKCQYGKHYRVQGKSQRASGFYAWIREFKDKYRDVVDVKLKEPKILSEVGDYIVLPYSHLHLSTEIGDGSYFNLFSDNNVWVEKKKFTAEFINAYILEFYPQALFGGAIYSFQDKEVPKFLKHLMRFDKNLFDETLALNPVWAEKSKTFSDVGRKAILNTLNPNIGKFKDIHGGLWTYDGQFVYCGNRNASFCLVNKVKEIRLEPEYGEVVVITDDAQVNDNTEFID